MRRALCLLLICLLVMTAGGVYAAQMADAPAYQVRFDRQVLFGEPEKAAGLEIQNIITYKDHLFWDSVVKEGAQPIVATDFFYDRGNPYKVTSDQSMGMGFYIEYNACIGDMDMDAYSVEELEGLQRAFKELYDRTAPGDTNKETIRLSDYCQYYPISLQIQIKSSFYGTSLEHMQDGGSSLPDSEVVKALMAYFKIPVKENILCDMEVGKSETAAMRGNRVVETMPRQITNNENGDQFNMVTGSVVTDQACYFYFSNRTLQGQIVDTSQIPGGYGIYCLPYVEEKTPTGQESCRVLTDRLTCLFPVREQDEILHISASRDGDYLLLHTAENGQYVITVISTQTGKMLDRYTPFDYDPDLTAPDYYDGETLMAVRYNGKLVALTQVQATYEMVIEAVEKEIEKTQVFFPQSWSMNHMALSYNGQYLALADNRIFTEEGQRAENCGFFLAIYDKEGLCYYGYYHSSLDTTDYYPDRGFPFGGIDVFDKWRYDQTNLHPIYNRSVRLNWRQTS